MGEGPVQETSSERPCRAVRGLLVLGETLGGVLKMGCNVSRLRQRVALLALLLALTTAAAQSGSDTQSEANPLRFDFTPSAGYRTSMSFGISPQVQGSNARVVFDSSPSYGAAFGFRLDDDNLVEFRWARQDTYMRVEEFGQSSGRQRVVLTQFHGDFTHEYVIEDWPPWARPFVLGSIGATHIVGPSNGFTRFSFGLGGGVKFFANRHLGFKLQGEWLPIWVTPEINGFVCGGGCVARFGGTVSSQGEFSAGPVLRF